MGGITKKQKKKCIACNYWVAKHCKSRYITGDTGQATCLSPQKKTTFRH